MSACIDRYTEYRLKNTRCSVCVLHGCLLTKESLIHIFTTDCLYRRFCLYFAISFCWCNTFRQRKRDMLLWSISAPKQNHPKHNNGLELVFWVYHYNWYFSISHLGFDNVPHESFEYVIHWCFFFNLNCGCFEIIRILQTEIEQKFGKQIFKLWYIVVFFVKL